MKVKTLIVAVMAVTGLTVPTMAYAQANSPQGVAQRLASLEAAVAALLNQRAVPSGAVMFFSLDACPAGWTEFEAAQGRYLVGLTPNGAPGAEIGTALSDQENRPVGQHTHSINDPGHSHSFLFNSTALSYNPFGLNEGFVKQSSPDSLDQKSYTLTITTGSTMTGVTANPTGEVAGTNAPYIQLRACQKN